MEWSGCEAIRVWAVSETGPVLGGWGLQKGDRAGGELREAHRSQATCGCRWDTKFGFYSKGTKSH